jgi:cbb3-type cytochrome oxidase maturation protein
MSVMFVLVPVALFVVGLAIAAYAWAARRGQFDDLTTPAMRMLHDEDSTGPGTSSRPLQRKDPLDRRAEDPGDLEGKEE